MIYNNNNNVLNESIFTLEYDDVNFDPSDYDVKEFFEAAYNGDYYTVEDYLNIDIDVNVRNKNNSTALMYASIQGENNIVELLLENGAEVNARNNDKLTALNFAIEGHHYSTVEILIKAGADVNTKDKEGMTPLMYASEDDCKKNRRIIKLLLDAEADINVKDNRGRTALSIAEYYINSNVDLLINTDIKHESKSIRKINELFGVSKKPKIEPYETKLFSQIEKNIPKKTTITNKDTASKENVVELKATIETNINANENYLQILVNTTIQKSKKEHEELKSEFRIFTTEKGSELQIKGIVNNKKMFNNRKIIDNFDPKTTAKSILNIINNDIIYEVVHNNKKITVEPYTITLFKKIASNIPNKIIITNKDFANKKLGTSLFNLESSVKTNVTENYLQILVNTDLKDDEDKNKSHGEVKSEFRLFTTARNSELQIKGLVNNKKMFDNGKIIDNYDPESIVQSLIPIINKAIALEITQIARVTESLYHIRFNNSKRFTESEFSLELDDEFEFEEETIPHDDVIELGE